MKRVIIKAPESTFFYNLTAEQQAAIASVSSQFLDPMPGTKPNLGYKIITALVNDSFDPIALVELAFPFEILGLWQWSGIGDPVELLPLSPGFVNFLDDVVVYDEDENVVSTLPSPLYDPCIIAGWPTLF